MLQARALVVGTFAVAGAVISAWTAPALLDYLFNTVKNQSITDRPSPTTQVNVPKYVFRKVTFRGKSGAESLASARQAILQAETRRNSGQPGYLSSLCAQRREGITCEEEPLSENALKTPAYHYLSGMKKAGDLALAVDHPARGAASVYELMSIGQSTGSTFVDEGGGYPGSRQPLMWLAFAMLGAILGGAAGNVLVKVTEGLSVHWDRMETGDRVNLFLSILVGIIVSLPFLIVFGNLGALSATILTLGLTVGFTALGMYLFNSMEEVLPWKKGEVRGRPSGIKVLDTNVLIDGRVYDLMRTGFLEGELYVPKFVLRELQHIADSPDALRRQRGRRGLEVLRHMQSEHPVEVGTHDRFAPDEREDVDSRLVRVAKGLGADLVSNDYNLNRVASIQEVRVLNINDLALALRPNVLPGETLELTIIREGNQPGQGVGYLEDGTMVVVENGKAHLGEHLTVSVTQVIQTERGKMIFGTLDGNDHHRGPR